MPRYGRILPHSTTGVEEGSPVQAKRRRVGEGTSYGNVPSNDFYSASETATRPSRVGPSVAARALRSVASNSCLASAPLQGTKQHSKWISSGIK